MEKTTEPILRDGLKPVLWKTVFDFIVSFLFDVLI